MKYPKIHLAVDNCFASKRWTTPSQWLRLTKMIGVKYVEASADNGVKKIAVEQMYTPHQIPWTIQGTRE